MKTMTLRLMGAMRKSAEMTYDEDHRTENWNRAASSVMDYRLENGRRYHALSLNPAMLPFSVGALLNRL